MLVAPSDVDAAYAAAQVVVETHRRLAKHLRPGMTLAQIDTFVAKTLSDQGSKSCFLGYRVGRSPAFPSHACLSVNECVVHGTAGYYTKPMAVGDLLKIDIGVWHKGLVGDAAWTYSFGPPAPIVRKLMDAGKESLRRGVATLDPKNTYIEWARVVQNHVEKECGFHLVRGLGGHGYGRKLHGPPFVSNTMPTYAGEWPDANAKCRPGTLVAVEPMIAIGTGLTYQHGNEWPVFIKDGSLSVHHEHDVLITDKGPRVLTEGLDEINDVIAV